MDTKKQRQRKRDDARLTRSGNARSEQLNTRGAYRVAINQQSLACLSGSERQRPGWFLDMKYQTCFFLFFFFWRKKAIHLCYNTARDTLYYRNILQLCQNNVYRNLSKISLLESAVLRTNARYYTQTGTDKNRDLMRFA